MRGRQAGRQGLRERGREDETRQRTRAVTERAAAVGMSHMITRALNMLPPPPPDSLFSRVRAIPSQSPSSSAPSSPSWNDALGTGTNGERALAVMRAMHKLCPLCRQFKDEGGVATCVCIRQVIDRKRGSFTRCFIRSYRCRPHCFCG